MTSSVAWERHRHFQTEDGRGTDRHWWCHATCLTAHLLLASRDIFERVSFVALAHSWAKTFSWWFLDGMSGQRCPSWRKACTCKNASHANHTELWLFTLYCKTHYVMQLHLHGTNYCSFDLACPCADIQMLCFAGMQNAHLFLGQWTLRWQWRMREKVKRGGQLCSRTLFATLMKT